MTFLEFLDAYWKDGLFYLVLGSGLIQISPIKLYPFSWIARKIGNALNADLMKRLDNTDKSLDALSNKLSKHIEEDERNNIDDCRRRILTFNEKVLSEDHVTKERYDSILEDIDTYEKYCLAHPDYPNSKAILSIQNLKEDYTRRYRVVSKEE